jgi:hypothetical protein
MAASAAFIRMAAGVSGAARGGDGHALQGDPELRHASAILPLELIDRSSRDLGSELGAKV